MHVSGAMHGGWYGCGGGGGPGGGCGLLTSLPLSSSARLIEVGGDRRCEHTQTIARVSDGCKGQEDSKARRWRQNEGRYT
jgi:hypothetical protein